MSNEAMSADEMELRTWAAEPNNSIPAVMARWAVAEIDRRRAAIPESTRMPAPEQSATADQLRVLVERLQAENATLNARNLDLEQFASDEVERWTEVKRANDRLQAELAKIRASLAGLLAACKMAANLTRADLVEPGRSVFWACVGAIKNAEAP